MRWRVRGSLGQKRRTSVLVEAPDAQTACSTAQDLGLTVLSVEVDEALEVGIVEPDALLTVPVEEQLPMLIERTGKRWKGLLGVSALVIALGLVGAGAIVAGDPRSLGEWPVALVGSLMLAGLGFVGIVWARLGAWWYHG